MEFLYPPTLQLLTPTTIVTAIAILLLTLTVYLTIHLKTRPQSPIPSLPLREYLPGGLALPIILDARKAIINIVALRQRYGPLFTIHLGPFPTLVTANPVDIAHILTSTTDFDRPAAMRHIMRVTTPNGLFDMPADTHRRARSCLRDKFNHSHLRLFHSRMQEAVMESISTFRQRVAERPYEAFDLAVVLGTVTLRIITNVAFGASWDAAKRRAFGEDTMHFLDGLFVELLGHPYRAWLNPASVKRNLHTRRDALRTVCRQLIEDRMAESAQDAKERPEDILDAILAFEHNDVVTAISNVLVFAVAGAHTVNQEMVWLFYEVAQRADVLAAIDDELEAVVGVNEDVGEMKAITHEEVYKLRFLSCVWKETLRLHPPGGIMIRESIRDVELKGSGTTVGKGTAVMGLLACAATDEAWWSEGEKFDPWRWVRDAEEGEGWGHDRQSPVSWGLKVPAGAYVPFGVGVKSCAAQFFADYEGVMVVAELLRRFRFELACGAEEVVPVASWTVVGRVSSGGEGGWGADMDHGIPFRVRVCGKKAGENTVGG